jgi:F-type H+-transporting ATPase subunit epsilon
MATLKVVIIGKDKILYEGEAESVFVPTKTGIIEVLPEHMQLVSALAPGEIILKTKDESKTFKVTGGVLEVRAGSNVIILADIVKE